MRLFQNFFLELGLSVFVYVCKYPVAEINPAN